MPTGPLQSRGQKRSAAAAAASAGSVSSPDIPDHIRKVHKVSRACDQCKARKTRCSGTLPCERCVLRRLDCVYDAEYARGRPPTPPPSLPTPAPRPGPAVTPGSDTAEPSLGQARPVAAEPSTTHGGSPEEVEAAAEAERQDFDPTSGLAFFQRAHQRLVAQQPQSSMNTTHSLGGGSSEHCQLLASAGDKPLLVNDANSAIPGGVDMPPDFPSLVDFYFESCVVTYRMFAQQSAVAAWAQAVQQNTQQGLAPAQGIGNAKAAIVLAIAAIAVLKSDRAQLHTTNAVVGDERPSLQKADRYYSMAASLIEAEVGLPCLESVQARLVQVLYLLQTARMNKAWYLLGTAWQIAAALELHRRQGRKRGTSSVPNYILLQGQRRTFWVAYTIDVYLSVVLGRPRHIHDEDIDQELPAAVSDEDMGPEGPIIRADREEGDDETDSNMDSVIAHAQLAEIIGTISSKVYSIKNLPREERLAAASRSGKELSAWRSRLPPHLSSVQPRSLIPSLRRQAIAMRLAHCHAVMHANRPFLLGGSSQSSSTPGASSAPLEGESVAECIAAAKTALRTVQSMAADSTLLHAFWWTPYVTFCALAVVYVWEIQQSAGGGEGSEEDRRVLELAEKCHARLAQSVSADSPSWRYTVILEELRHSAQVLNSGNLPANLPAPSSSDGLLPPHHLEAVHQQPSLIPMSSSCHYDDAVAGASNVCDIPLPFFQEWQTTDWRYLDASVCMMGPMHATPIVLLIVRPQAFGLFGDLGTSIDPFSPSINK
ncbi:fungal-specific transcription factor domain-containing protein [Apiospora marii]